ncbi:MULTISPECIES: methionine adenosyltransferase [unclassified Mycoplasma]|uniref:methionine adenosyltransferase n=1 Tax=unclassified Mycoplasma TaxID=2683645 RepID=UPI00211CACE3|nr:MULTISPECIES: methionine adenosyltransferase [unclassified Mycoplasma]UUM20006.1 methionine adenosyltransferase [Mycoplasma sp. 1578d]UUM24987.1 methionine adenosyltransferase [Mycoplasma sp. 3686d]
MKKLFTSESVGRGHPDKVCDQISDAILDSYLTLDPHAKVAIETLASGNMIVIAGEVKSNVDIDVIEIAKNLLRELGYYSYKTSIIVDIKEQSSDINQGVELGEQNGQELGAGDQGIMFGYATNETPQYMPLAIMLANEIVKIADKYRVNGKFKWAKADMKSQVTLDYTNPQQTKIDTILFSVQHSAKYNKEQFEDFIKNCVLAEAVQKYNLALPDKLLINPTGNFVIGGPLGDTGLTGRKIIVDTYGGAARHGGGAFSGKDATKMDRSGAYAARWIAKNIVAAGLADRVEIQIAYSIGLAQVVSIMVECFGTNKVDVNLIEQAVEQLFDLTPKGIINALDLRKPKFFETSYYGHFGRDEVDFTWERLDRVEQLKEFIARHQTK